MPLNKKIMAIVPLITLFYGSLKSYNTEYNIDEWYIPEQLKEILIIKV